MGAGGPIRGVRTAGSQRLYGGDNLRRMAVMQTARRLGMALAEVARGAVRVLLRNTATETSGPSSIDATCVRR